jgi:hypothetical protein
VFALSGISLKNRLEKVSMHLLFDDTTYRLFFAHAGMNVNTSEEVAIKLESVRSKHPQLLYESKVIRYLKVRTQAKFSTLLCVC